MKTDFKPYFIAVHCSGGDWDEQTQIEIKSNNWTEAVNIAIAISKVTKHEVRLSTSAGFINQGYYFWCDRNDFIEL